MSKDDYREIAEKLIRVNRLQAIRWNKVGDEFVSCAEEVIGLMIDIEDILARNNEDVGRVRQAGTVFQKAYSGFFDCGELNAELDAELVDRFVDGIGKDLKVTGHAV